MNVDPVATDRLRDDWDQWGQGVPLVVLDSPFRSLMEPFLEYIEQVDAERPDDFLTVVLPEFVPAKWWHHLFHNQRALLIKGVLLFKPRMVVTSVPFHLRRQVDRTPGVSDFGVWFAGERVGKTARHCPAKARSRRASAGDRPLNDSHCESRLHSTGRPDRNPSWRVRLRIYFG